MRQTVLEFDDGAVTHSLVKVKLDELDEWDATHDASGKLIDSGASSEDLSHEPDFEEKVEDKV
jgi:hypothetical protein